ncbi:Ribonuclease BN, tRNA processing enzyme [Actinokineospora alba]|uniref:Ribonuclease BN, tRNA processing enzyme n=1 Tax=Actinokineospora alba TaxID=504798 RepID=A0A1H0VJZ1_9PSEU|nr:MBL fold metallo-hydrolase [Actinokineospora alba]TDP67660.1 ribonuclease BN (tRNA processing enzyme) [Actinokineospora alba]SDJ29039.1 Ribonuclease BN, tRNA processing enzyme [Actinokineospora alba]SDP78892.1 Ribonuclease BN, tRNA processing enzyme [Actinokineospora alba]
MLLTVLGCSGSFPGPNAPASGYLLAADDFLLGIELGNGAFAAMQTVVDPFDLDALMFSHLHADHCADFSGLSVLRRYHPAPPYDPRVNKLDVYAPSEAPTRFIAAYATDEADRAATDLSDVFEFHALRPGKVHIGPFEVVVTPAAHPCESFSFRISHGGRSLAYTGDTAMNDALVEVVDGADVLLSEASWTHSPNHPPNLHLSGHEAGVLAAGAGVERVLVTHIPPWTDKDAVMAEVRAAYDGEVVLVEQGAKYDI